jgi:hypothetical protein
MEIEPAQVAWLNRFTGNMIVVVGAKPEGSGVNDLTEQLRIARSKEEVQEQALKEMLIARATEALDAHTQEMRDAFDMEVEVDGKKMDTRDKKGRQEMAYDTRNDKLTGGPVTKKAAAKATADGTQPAPKMESAAGTGPKDPEELDKLKIGAPTDGKAVENQAAADATKMMALIVKQKDELAKATTERTGLNKKKTALEKKREPLFTDKEIMDELYTPLVRQLVLPENFIPKKYSATQKMIDGSNDPYIKECKAKGGKMPNGVADFAKGVITLASTTAAAIDTSMFKDPTTITTIATGVAALLNATIDGVTTVVKKDFTVNDWSGITSAIGSAIGGFVGAGTANSNLGSIIGGAISAGMSGGGLIVGRFVSWRKDGGDFPIDDLINDIANSFAAGFKIASGKVGQDKDNAQIGVALTGASAGIAALFKNGIAMHKAGIVTAIRTGQWSKLEVIFVGAMGDVGKTIITTVSAEVGVQIKADTSLTKTEQGEAGKANTSQTATDTGAVDAETAAGKAILAVQAQLEAKEIAYKKAKQTEEAAGALEALEKERENFRKSLDRLGTDTPTDEDFKSIAKLIEQIESSRAKWAAIVAIGQAATSVATAFFAPMNAAGELVNFIVNARAAYDRAVALSIWVDANESAITAVSPYATSIQNFIRNQGEQFTHYSIQAAANAIKVATDIAANVHPAIKAASIAVTAAASLESLVYTVYKQATLRKAWATTKKSLQDPENRKLALIARKMNPTLAKYTIAYGALIEKSPIAITVMGEVGVDRETLSRAGDKVGDVKKYLQTLYNEDNVVLGNLPDLTKGKKKPPTPALTAKAWMTSITIWRAQDGLATPVPGTIVKCLAQVERYSETDDEERPLEEFPRYQEVLQQLALALRGYRPATEVGTPIDPVAKAVSVYVDLAEAEFELVEQALDARSDAAEQVKLAA